MEEGKLSEEGLHEEKEVVFPSAFLTGFFVSQRQLILIWFLQ